MSKKNRIVIVGGKRTPFSKMGTELAHLDAVELGRIAVNQLLLETGIRPEIIDETIFGCVGQPAHAANLARVIALRAGIPEHTPAITVHRNCASGIESLTTAAEKIAAGRGEVYLVGGTESMSQIPLLFQMEAAIKFGALARAKTMGKRLAGMAAFRPVDFRPLIGLRLGLTDPVTGLNMGETAEILARENGISRLEQDAFALASHMKAVHAEDLLREEIVPVLDAKNPVDRDNGPRPQQTMEALAKLKPVFDRRNGSVTPGNASQITDGAVALLVMPEARAKALGLEPLGVIREYAYTGCDPRRMGLGPVSAIQSLHEKTGLTPQDADVIEMNEAFAAQVLACVKQLKTKGLEVPTEKLNVNGGSIALGHPVGATGSRLLLTALRELKRRDGKHALVSLCVGGGQGAAVWLERN